MDEKHPGEPWLPLDTTLEAARVQVRVLRGLTMDQRFRAALALSAAAREASQAGIRARHPEYTEEQVVPQPEPDRSHPEYTEEQVRLAAIRLRLGDDLFRLAFPGQEVAP